LQVPRGACGRRERDNEASSRRRADRDEDAEQDDRGNKPDVPGSTPTSDLGGSDVAAAGSVLAVVGWHPGQAGRSEGRTRHGVPAATKTGRDST
jgi:hypothetical protein